MPPPPPAHPSSSPGVLSLTLIQKAGLFLQPCSGGLTLPLNLLLNINSFSDATAVLNGLILNIFKLIEKAESCRRVVWLFVFWKAAHFFLLCPESFDFFWFMYFLRWIWLDLLLFWRCPGWFGFFKYKFLCCENFFSFSGPDPECSKLCLKWIWNLIYFCWILSSMFHSWPDSPL